jgi:hypothetical protein
VIKMKKNILVAAVVVGLIIAGVAALAGSNRWFKTSADDRVVLPDEVKEAVLEALMGPEGEYAAYATYAAILEKYGEVNPFANIMESEARHIESLKRILDRYGVPYPSENLCIGMIEAPDSLAEAAQAGVDTEIANVALYEQQLEAVGEYPDILKVFLNLQSASQEKHLPAFQRAAEHYADV